MSNRKRPASPAAVAAARAAANEAAAQLDKPPVEPPAEHPNAQSDQMPLVHPSQMLSVVLSATEWNVVLAALQDAPLSLRVIGPVFMRVQQQLKATEGQPFAPAA
jgi:hypothetical protein